MVEFNEGIRSRIVRLMYMESLNQEQFAKRLGMSPQNLGRMVNGNRDISRTFPNRICEAFPEVRKEWLLWGEGAMYQTEQRAEEAEALIADDVKNNTKPRLPITAAAGTLSDYLGGVLAHECEQIPIIRSMPDYDFTMIVKGDSMEPKFEGGDEIACKKVNSLIEPGKTYVLSTRDGAVLKRIYPEEDGVRCVSYNHEEYPDFKVNGDDILGVYRVVGLIRI